MKRPDLKKLAKGTYRIKVTSQPSPGAHYSLDSALIDHAHQEVLPSLPANCRRVGAVVWYEDSAGRVFFGVHIGKTFHHINPATEQILHMYPDEGDPGYYGPLWEGEFVQGVGVDAVDRVIDEIGKDLE